MLYVDKMIKTEVSWLISHCMRYDFYKEKYKKDFTDNSLTFMFNPKEEMILYNSDILQPFDELFEVAIHAAAKFTTEYKASETADEVDGVCDSANEVCALKTKQITLICRSY